MFYIVGEEFSSYLNKIGLFFCKDKYYYDKLMFWIKCLLKWKFYRRRKKGNLFYLLGELLLVV